MEREQLERAGLGDERFCVCTGGVGQRRLCGRLFHNGGRGGFSLRARAYLEQPYLSMLRSGGDVTLSWPTFYETFALQQNAEVSNSNDWSDANYPLTTN